MTHPPLCLTLDGRRQEVWRDDDVRKAITDMGLKITAVGICGFCAHTEMGWPCDQSMQCAAGIGHARRYVDPVRVMKMKLSL